MPTDLGFQINYIYNQLILKLLGIPLRYFLYCIICGKNSYPKSVPHFLAAVYFKRRDISKHFLLPYCPPSHWQLYLSCCREMSSLILESTYLRCKCRLKICNSLGIVQDSGTRWSRTLQLWHCWPYCQETLWMDHSLYATLINSF